MTGLPLGVVVIAASSNSSSGGSGSSVFLLVLIAIVAVAYFAFLRPQQQRAKQQREKGRQVEVGDEIVTVGGIVGRVVDTEDDRIVLVTGGEVSGAPREVAPTRMVVLRQAVARKVEPPAVGAPEDDEREDLGATGTDGSPPEEEPRT